MIDCEIHSEVTQETDSQLDLEDLDNVAGGGRTATLDSLPEEIQRRYRQQNETE